MKLKQRWLRLWPLYFLLVSLEAAVALLVLVQIPSEGLQVYLGFSLARWALFIPLMGALIAALVAAIFSHKNDDFRNLWLNPDSRPMLFSLLMNILPSLSAVLVIGSYLLRWYDPARMLPFFERAWPLLAFLIVISIQSALWLLLLKFDFHYQQPGASKPTVIAFVILLLTFGFIGLTKLGLTPDPAYWGEPGIPIQGWQLGLAIIISLLFLTSSLHPFAMRNAYVPDILIAAGIWVLAVAIWQSIPNGVLKNSFYFPIDPPANIPFPHSDSAYYDSMAHSLLLGNGYQGQIPTRPLYIVFLAIQHILFGEQYNLIIRGQTLVLAVIPILFFTLGRKLHSRTAGIFIALLAIFREWTSLLVSSETRVSNSKMLLVDLPTLLLLLAACLLSYRWLERKDRLSAFIAGGSFGILLLLRTQSMLILPVLFATAFLALRTGKRLKLITLLVFLSGILVSVAPWLIHNYLRSGHITFDAPFQYQVLASQYAYTGNLDYSSIDLEGKGAGGILLAFAIKDPAFVVGFIGNHFLATEIHAVLALPLIAPFEGLHAPINLYWTSFNGILAWKNILLLILYLVIIAIGLGASWRRLRWTGMLPLIFNLGYAFANGVGRFSGWRYDLPADWVAYFYFGIGATEIIFNFGKGFGANPENYFSPHRKAQSGHNPTIAGWLSLIVTFTFIGGLPWIAEGLGPPRYADMTPELIQEQITESPSVTQMNVTAEKIQTFSAQPESVTLIGRTLYPRYFARGAGIPSSTPWPSYKPRDFPRLGFKLINQNIVEVVLPIKSSSLENIHGADTLLLGCQRKQYIEARLILYPDRDLAYLSNLGLSDCSP